MTKAELDVLERDVEDARGRLRLDLARLRAPGTMERMKDDVTGRVTGAAQDTAYGILDEIKARAAANPVAALAIGAGLAWRFIHRPPIATLLVGAGLVALMKTDPHERHMGADFVERAGEFAGTVKETVSEKIDELSHSEFAARASELSGTFATKASEVGEIDSAVMTRVGSGTISTAPIAVKWCETIASVSRSAATSVAGDGRPRAACRTESEPTLSCIADRWPR